MRGYKIALRNNKTGEVRLSQHDFPWDGTQEYIWSHGNYSCDCNRALFYYDWGKEADEHECGDSAFSALYVELPSGARISLQEDATHG